MFDASNAPNLSREQIADLNRELNYRLDMTLAHRDVTEEYAQFLQQGVKDDYECGQRRWYTVPTANNGFRAKSTA